MTATVTRRLTVAVAAGVVLAGAAWWTSARAGGQADDHDAGAEVATTTAAVTRRDLRATEEVDGTLGYGEARRVANQRQGTVTALPSEGAVVTRGQALYRVDGKPVPLLYGRLPAWRELSVGSTTAPTSASWSRTWSRSATTATGPSPSTTTSAGRPGPRCSAGRRC